MTAVYPLIERIAEQICTRIEAVQIANNYQVDVAEVLRPTRIGNVGDLNFVPKDLLAVVEQGPCVTAVEEVGNSNPNTKQREQVFYIGLYRLCSKADTVPIDRKLNVFIADVEMALTLGKTPGANWQQFIQEDDSHLAVNSRLADPQYFSLIEHQAAGATVQFAVTYRHPVSDPYTVA
ncbi:MAG: hypothetical protein AB7U73_01835 [Pirellulales bacterium]